MKSIIINKELYYYINVPEDGYRETLVQNPELKDRYGFLEITSRSTGLDSRFRIHNIKSYELVGMYAEDSNDEIASNLRIKDCFVYTKKVVLLKFK